MEDDVYATLAAANAAIADWINGGPPDTDDAFYELRALCHPDLSIVHPHGNSQEQGAILADLRASHGRNADFRIATPREHTRLLHEDAETVIAEFVELQDGAKLADRPRNARRITAICMKDHAAPHGLLIWRLHENLIAQADEDALDWSALD